MDKNRTVGGWGFWMGGFVMHSITKLKYVSWSLGDLFVWPGAPCVIAIVRNLMARRKLAGPCSSTPVQVCRFAGSQPSVYGGQTLQGSEPEK